MRWKNEFFRQNPAPAPPIKNDLREGQTFSKKSATCTPKFKFKYHLAAIPPHSYMWLLLSSQWNQSLRRKSDSNISATKPFNRGLCVENHSGIWSSSPNISAGRNCDGEVSCAKPILQSPTAPCGSKLLRDIRIWVSQYYYTPAISYLFIKIISSVYLIRESSFGSVSLYSCKLNLSIWFKRCGCKWFSLLHHIINIRSFTSLINRSRKLHKRW